MRPLPLDMDGLAAAYCLNIQHTFEAATAHQMYRATKGENSYQHIRHLCHEIALDCGRPISTVIAVTAVLSPVISWEENISHARALCCDIATERFSALPANVAKARRVLAGESTLDVIRGQKVWNFYWSILDPTNSFSVCVDRHVCRAAVGWGMSWRETDVRLKMPGTYRQISWAIRRHARYQGLLPLELQALLWLVMRENVFQTRMFGDLHD